MRVTPRYTQIRSFTLLPLPFFPQAPYLVHCWPGRQSEGYSGTGEQSAACWGHLPLILHAHHNGILVIFSSLQYFGRKRGSIATNLSYNNKTVTFVVGNHHKRTDGPRSVVLTPLLSYHTQSRCGQQNTACVVYHQFEMSLGRMLALFGSLSGTQH